MEFSLLEESSSHPDEGVVTERGSQWAGWQDVSKLFLQLHLFKMCHKSLFIEIRMVGRTIWGPILPFLLNRRDKHQPLGLKSL